MDKKLRLVFFVLILLLLVSCQNPVDEITRTSIPEKSSVNQDDDLEGATEVFMPEPVPDYQRIQPDELIYRGVFRLPDPSGGSNWEYSGHGLTFFPAGDPGGELDGYPGSLFGFGHDHQLFVSEINIPAPVITRNLEDAPTAETLQPFGDLTGGIFRAEELTIPRAGLEFVDDPQPGLYFTFGQHFQDFEPSHGWGGLDLMNPHALGPWLFAGYTNYVTNDYLFAIPDNWAAAIASGPLLASGRAREGLWSGRGPALFSFPANQSIGPGEVLTGVVPLLLYGEQGSGQPDIISSPDQAVIEYREADHWWGGAWLTSGEKAAVILVGTKALGDEWYGFSNGVVWEHDCAESTPSTCPDVPDWPYDNRGFWADDYQAQIIFYDPADLAGVARGELNSWDPQPYAVLALDDILLEPNLDPAIYKRDLVGAVAFDRENGLLYLIERLAENYKSIVHVFQLKG